MMPSASVPLCNLSARSLTELCENALETCISVQDAVAAATNVPCGNSSDGRTDGLTDGRSLLPCGWPVRIEPERKTRAAVCVCVCLPSVED